MNLRRHRYLLFLDVVRLALAPFQLFTPRFEGLQRLPQQLHNVIILASVTIPARIPVYYLFGVSRMKRRYAGIAELELVIIAGVSGSALAAAVGANPLPDLGAITSRIPVSVLFNSGVLSVVLLAVPCFLIRMGGWRNNRRGLHDSPYCVRGGGAGAVDQVILEDLSSYVRLGLSAVGFADGDRSKNCLRVGKVPSVWRAGPVGAIPGATISFGPLCQLVDTRTVACASQWS